MARARSAPKSTATELPQHYDFAGTDHALYERWERGGVLAAAASRSERTGGSRPPFVVIMPPPNVTGVLHMGHGLNNTVQDVIVRWRRMCGDETLWVPGTDHAGIATQNVVEKQLAVEGKTRFDAGREAFVARTHAWVAETGGTILQQLKAIGASADWTRTAYTLDPGPSRAVREAFVRLHEDGLIYRGHRVIHWCPRCQTSLSDEEAEHGDAQGSLYYIRYALADEPSRSVIIATTRPETLFADVAVAVNPADDRYRDLQGKRVVLPIVGVELPVIADDYVDPEFGTGALKITPAHDPNDYDVGVRHGLPMPVVISATGVMAEESDASGRVPRELQGLDRFEARTRIVEMLRERGALERIEQHALSLRHCYRCDTIVEPRLSDQWFVRMEPLARPALAAVRSGRVRILPERWEAVYVNWLEGIRDWNISRQLWWGHRIPVWYCDDCDPPQDIIVSRDDITKCPHCDSPVRRDEDVLDTWFSSWLWPFSTLGWPATDSADLKAFYPSDVLVTAPEILFFWVARMVMAGCRFMGETPFHTVYLTGTARDTNHVRMQKSLGNGIDPLDVVDRYGADALRYTVVSGMGQGADLILDPADLERSFGPGRNFVTKLWNIGRYLLANVGSEPASPLSDIADERLTRADRWILARLDAAIAECDQALGPARPEGWARRTKDAAWPASLRSSGLRLNEVAETARRFVWNELADWYLESVKHRVQGPREGDDRAVARAVLVHAFDAALRLLHPVVPFITETLWQRLPLAARDAEYLAVAAWPRPTGRGDTSDFDRVRDAVTALRQIRADYAIAPAQSVTAVVVGGDTAVYAAERETFIRLARADVTVASAAPRTAAAAAAAHAVLADGSEIIVPLADLVDLDRECTRLRTELSELERHLQALGDRLSNERFVARAPANVVEAEREKQRDWSARREQLSRKVRDLCGA